MTKEERAKVFMAAMEIDGRCSPCIEDFVERLQELLPDEPIRAEFGEHSQGEWEDLWRAELAKMHAERVAKAPFVPKVLG
jgi:hypothetical protein